MVTFTSRSLTFQIQFPFLIHTVYVIHVLYLFIYFLICCVYCGVSSFHLIESAYVYLMRPPNVRCGCVCVYLVIPLCVSVLIPLCTFCRLCVYLSVLMCTFCRPRVCLSPSPCVPRAIVMCVTRHLGESKSPLVLFFWSRLSFSSHFMSFTFISLFQAHPPLASHVTFFLTHRVTLARDSSPLLSQRICKG